jgi:hypothetical protein
MAEEVESDSELRAVCGANGLRIIEQLTVPDGGSDFLGRVIDSNGIELLLKRGSGLRGDGEIRVLRAWQATGHTPGLLKALDSQTFTCEWIDGVTLDRSERDAGALLRRCGKVIRDLHAVEAPAGLMTLRVRASPEWTERDLASRLPNELREAARTAASKLSTYDQSDVALLHGDFVPGNVMVTGNRMVVIDPIGFAGPGGWDVAQLAVAFEGRDRRANLESIVKGYGLRPAGLKAAFAYMTLLFLAKELQLEQGAPGTRSQCLADLWSLAEAIC